jgi:AraC family transcriptional regulator, transcriptional activator FtrA
MRTVSVLAFDGMAPFELGAVVEVFGLLRPELGIPWYELSVCAERPGPLLAVGGFTMTVRHGLQTFAAADTVIVPGAEVHGEVSPRVVAALRHAHARGARVVSICSGAFALAAAGLLDGREATTHWKYAELLQRRYPRVLVNPDVLYVDGGDVLSSAGSAAGLDLCLHLVRRDHGAQIANAVARRLVIPPHREGGQAQFIEASVREVSGDDDGVERSMAWALANLAEPMTVGDLARRAHLARRTYLRQFARRVGTSPMRWVISQRIAASLPLLEASDVPIEDVGTAVGFDSPITFRHHFGRAMRTSPSAYRRSFRGGRA